MAAGGGADQVEALTRTKLPIFRGNAGDTLETVAWCETVDRQKAAQAWVDDKTATCAIDSFREEAAVWFKVVRKEEPAAVKNWLTFRPLIVQRFCETKSPAQRVALIANLTQKQNQTTQGFYDHVAQAFYEVVLDDEEAITGADKAAELRGFARCQNALLKYFYVAGLRPAIREQVELTLTKTSTLKEVRERAQTAMLATSATGRKKPTVAAVVARSGAESASRSDSDAQGTEIAQLIAALKGSNFGAKTSSASHDPSKPKQPQSTAATKKLGPMAERGWIYCNRCCQWGLHIRAECTWSMDHIRTVPKMDQKTKPSSTPCDPQYPNV